MVIIEPCAGLANRMYVIATAYVYASKYGHEAEILWDIDDTLGIALEELFILPERIRIRYATKRSYKKEPLKRLRGDIRRSVCRKCSDYILTPKEVDRIRKSGDTARLDEIFSTNRTVYVQSFESLYYVKDNSPFRIFAPAEKVLKRGESVLNRITEKTYGVHIRRTDNEEAIRNSPAELFERKVEELLADEEASVFLATDDSGIDREFRRRWGCRIMTNESKCFSRKNADGMLDSAVDMLALSKCQCIYGSYYSTFNEMAARLGNKELIVLKA